MPEDKKDSPKSTAKAKGGTRRARKDAGETVYVRPMLSVEAVVEPYGEDDFDTKGWKRMKALKNAAPVYLNAVSKDGKELYAPRFVEGEEVLVPQDAQTDRYVELGYLER